MIVESRPASRVKDGGETLPGAILEGALPAIAREEGGDRTVVLVNIRVWVEAPAASRPQRMDWSLP